MFLVSGYNESEDMFIDYDYVETEEVAREVFEKHIDKFNAGELKDIDRLAIYDTELNESIRYYPN